MPKAKHRTVSETEPIPQPVPAGAGKPLDVQPPAPDADEELLGIIGSGALGSSKPVPVADKLTPETIYAAVKKIGEQAVPTSYETQTVTWQENEDGTISNAKTISFATPADVTFHELSLNTKPPAWDDTDPWPGEAVQEAATQIEQLQKLEDDLPFPVVKEPWPYPWAEGTLVAPATLLAWLREPGQTLTKLQLIAKAQLVQSQESTCFMHNHEGRIDQLQAQVKYLQDKLDLLGENDLIL